MTQPWEDYKQKSGPWSDYKQVIEKQPKTWSSVAGEAVSNIPSSAAKMATGIAQAVTHPIDTASSLLDVSAGALRASLPKPVVQAVDYIDKYIGNPEATKRASKSAAMVGDFMANRYGGIDNLKETIAKDPVGFLTDVSTVLGGGASILKTAGMATKAQPLVKAGEIVTQAADITNPMTAAMQVSKPIIGSVSAVGRGIRNVVSPAISKAGTNAAVGRLVNQISGKKADEIASLLRSGEIDETAVQAAITAGSPEFTALGEMVKSLHRPGEYDAIAKLQEAARMAGLKKVTPNLQEAEAARSAVADVGYGKAFASDAQRIEEAQKMAQMEQAIKTGGIGGFSPQPIKVTPEIASLEKYPAIKAAAKVAKDLNPDIGNPLTSVEGLHLMKVAIDNQFKNPSASTALQNYSNAALADVKTKLLGAIENISPAYRTARTVYAQMSQEVNQAKVLQEMASVLEKPTGGERVSPFLNVLGRGEQALLKKSTGMPRFEQGDLAKILTPEQINAVSKIKNELLRDQEIARLAQLGMKKITKETGIFETPLKLPFLLSKPVSIANDIIKRFEGTGGKKIEMTLADLMMPENKSKLADIMEKAKPVERVKLKRGIEAFRKMSPYAYQASQPMTLADMYNQGNQ